MSFKNYCIVVMGDTKNVSSELEHISETPINFLDATGVFIATFTSILQPNEIKELLLQTNRNFLLFELDPEKSSFNINKKSINDTLFGFLNDEKVKKMSQEFNDMVEHDSAVINRLSISLIDKLSPSEKQEKLNELIDFGLENLSENDKKLLPLLAK